MTPAEFLDLGHEAKLAALAERPELRTELPGMAAVAVARMLTVKVAYATRAPAAGLVVTFTPQPVAVEHVEGVAVIVTTADTDAPDVIRADPITATTNALGEVSVLLIPSALTVAADDGSRLTYRVGFGSGGTRYVDRVTMPDADVRLRGALDLPSAHG